MTTLLEKNIHNLVNGREYEIVSTGVSKERYGYISRAVAFSDGRTAVDTYIKENADHVIGHRYIMGDCYIVFGAKESAGCWPSGRFRVSKRRSCAIVRIVNCGNTDRIASFCEDADGMFLTYDVLHGEQADRYLRLYEASSAVKLQDVYNNPSTDKLAAIRKMWREESTINGFLGKVIAHNTRSFTYAFLACNADGVYLIVCTPKKRYAVRYA